MAAHLAVAGEAVLDDLLPRPAPVVVPAEGGQRHPQVARRQHAELAAEPPRRAAVVGHGDDGGRVVHDVAQRGERGVQAVPAAERDDLVVTERGHVTPARGRGGWRGRSARASTSRRAISSVMATLRCLPPVQPMAMVMNRLPSLR